MNLDEDCINIMENEVDNVAPKIVGILGLSESCDIAKIQTNLISRTTSHLHYTAKTAQPNLSVALLSLPSSNRDYQFHCTLQNLEPAWGYTMAFFETVERKGSKKSRKEPVRSGLFSNGREEDGICWCKKSSSTTHNPKLRLQ